MNYPHESSDGSVGSNFGWNETPFAAPFAAAAAWNAALAVSFGTWVGCWQAMIEGARGQATFTLMEGAFAPINTDAVKASDIDLNEAGASSEEASIIVEEEALPDEPESLQSVASPVAEVPSAESQAASVSAAVPTPATSKPPGLDGPRNGMADDLKMISGVGHKTEKTLNQLGIWHYEQIARWTRAETGWIDDYFKFKGRALRENWSGQADALAVGGADEYVRRFGKAPR